MRKRLAKTKLCQIFLTMVVLAVLCAASPVNAQERILAPKNNPTHIFEKYAEGVYFITGTGSIFVQSNCLMLEGARDVLIVDSHVTPAAARALIRAVKTITKKPVRYLVNSHYHFDHAHGNQVFPEGVDIIGHEYTREKLLGDVLNENTFLSFTQAIPEMLKLMEAQIAAQTNEAAKKRLQTQYDIQAAHVEALKETVPTPPNVTFDSKMSLFYGGREVQLLFLGRGHTGGDIMVYLPEDKMIFTGDHLLPGLAYMGDGFVDEWPATLERLNALDIEMIFPGHGSPMKGKSSITNFQAYLKDLLERVQGSRKKGLSAAEASKKIDMTDHRANFPQIVEPGVDIRAVERLYQRLDSAGE
jgi:glyoxylase-like metal-dependent hydrolase (beta-lactamase superfamily II)